MANQLHPKPQRRGQDESSEGNVEEPAKTQHRNQANTDLHRQQLCAVVLMRDLLDGQSLEAFVNTHPHDDHLRGVEDLSEAVEILAVWHSGHKPSKKYGDSYEQLKKVIDKVKEKHGTEAEVVLEGSRSVKVLGDAEYYVLAPAEYVIDDCKGVI